MPIKPGKQRGTWRVWVQLPNRKQRERKVVGPYTKAQEVEAALVLERDRLVKAAPGSILTVASFSDFCVTRYAPHARRELKESTWKQVRTYQVQTLIKTVIDATTGLRFGDVLLPELGPSHVASYRDARLRDTWRGKPLRRSAINNELRVLSAILNYARSPECSGEIAPPPVFKIVKLTTRGDKRRVRAWTPDEVARLFATAHRDDPDLVPMLAFLFNSGCRKGEAIACEWSWIDMPKGMIEGMIRIPSNEVWQPKSDMPRDIPISDALRAVLESRRGLPSRQSRYVFTTIHGGRFLRWPKDRWTDVRKAAGVPGTIHWTRHTFASYFLAATKDMHLLAQVLGHSHERVSALYSHMLPGYLAGARNAVNIVPVVAVPEDGAARARA